MLTQDVASYIKQYEAAKNHDEEYAAISAAADAMTTREDFECVLALIGERQMGSYIADNADDFDCNDAWGNGIASMEINENETLVSEWDSQGFYHVSLQTPEKAFAMIEEFRDANCQEPDEEED